MSWTNRLAFWRKRSDNDDAGADNRTLRSTFTNARKPDGVDTVLAAVKSAIPTVFVTGKFNFITIHYFWIMGNSFLWSVIFWGMGNVTYINALFFACGASTQSGLNPVDVNLLNTGQQFVLYFLAMICNPIVIHGSVVFVRLYWFERRFKDVVTAAQRLRRTRSRGRSIDSTTSDGSWTTGQGMRARVKQLIRGRKQQPANMSTVFEENESSDQEKQQQHSSSNSDSERPEDRRGSGGSEIVRLPQPLNNEQHIRFLQNQRLRENDDTVLHIPSPREFDRGGKVYSVENEDEHKEDETVEKVDSQEQTEQSSEESNTSPTLNMRQHITFNEPTVPRHRPEERTEGLPRVQTDKASTIDPASYNNDGTAVRKNLSSGRNHAGFPRSNTGRTAELTPYLSYQPTIARNSFFVNLTEEQREELGGIEYRALKTLAVILLTYFFFFHLFGILCLMPWIYHHYGNVPTGDGQGRAWWAVFTAASAFNDLGFTLTPDSMISFATATWPLLVLTYLIVIGNTGFPVMLRFSIWMVSKFTPVGSALWEELHFLLDHPRRCFTLLFPRATTWWLFFILVILNGMDLLFFVVLDLHDEAVSPLSGWFKFLDGLFQAASTRTAGFAVVNLAELHPGIQVSYLIMMYISVFPIAISMRRTNVYEEKSLGIYSNASDTDDEKDPNFVPAHIQKQLSFDLWYVFLGLFIIAIAEGARLENTNEYAFTLFSVLFEIVSAYGTVGLSLGYPNINASFSAEFSVLSKLVIIAMQIRGRHRGLPYALDKAVLLPSESLQSKEEAEGQRLVQRRRSSLGGLEATSLFSQNRSGADIRSTATWPRQNDEPDQDKDSGLRNRLQGNQSQNSVVGGPVDSHKSHVRNGLGVVLYSMTNAEESVKDSLDPKTK